MCYLSLKAPQPDLREEPVSVADPGAPAVGGEPLEDGERKERGRRLYLCDGGHRRLRLFYCCSGLA